MESVGLVTTVFLTTSLTEGTSGSPVVNQEARDSFDTAVDESQDVPVVQEGVGGRGGGG